MQDSLKLHVMISLAKPKHIDAEFSIHLLNCMPLHLFKNEESQKKKKVQQERMRFEHGSFIFFFSV